MDFQEMPLSSCFMEVSVVKAILFLLICVNEIFHKFSAFFF